MTKKYKLIKEYPGSPKLGTIVDRRGIFIYFDVDSPNVNMTVSQNYVENYPEYWEEVVEKIDYEVLSFVCNQNFNKLKKGEIITKQENGQYKGDNILTWEGEEGLVKMEHWSIYSVKRLFDGEVFSLNDKITSAFAKYYIHRISVIKDILFVDGLKDLSKPDGSRIHFRLANIKKADYLFTTKDGEEIYEKDNYCAVFYDFKYLEQEAIKNYKLDNAHWRFSTKETAQEFILLNKPCLSVTDVMNAGYGICNPHALLSIVNSKINGKAKN
jgi:hypothetical protein